MFRTVLIKKSSKLQYIQGYIVIYDGDEERRVYLKDISLLLIEATNSLITIPLLIQLIKHNVSVILCDERHHPTGTLLGFNNHYSSSGNIFLQLEWKEEVKDFVWIDIVKSKIIMQYNVLKFLNKPNQDTLLEYSGQIENKDKTNREGLAAKIYFTSIFGQEFNRKESTVINDLLNYGYSIILSCFNREIVQSGYLTQLGIFHKGKTNPHNLSSDFMEPFRPIVDFIVYVNLSLDDPLKEVRKLLTKKVIIDDEERYIDDAIRVYTNKIIKILNGDENNFPKLKLKEKEHYYSEKSYENNHYV